MNNEFSTLAELAEFAPHPPTEMCISDALRKAGFDRADQKERKRFESLVRAYENRRNDEAFARLGRFADEARARLDDAASDDEIIELASDLQSEAEAEAT